MNEYKNKWVYVHIYKEWMDELKHEWMNKWMNVKNKFIKWRNK